jgi:hypothetical protein
MGRPAIEKGAGASPGIAERPTVTIDANSSSLIPQDPDIGRTESPAERRERFAAPHEQTESLGEWRATLWIRARRPSALLLVRSAGRR